MIKMGSKWTDSQGSIFVVLGTINMEGKDWVYYRLESPKDHLPTEFSCFRESFLSRFSPIP